MIKPYPPATEAALCRLFGILGERERCLYAATEVQKLGRGGLAYLARLLDCDKKTIRRGLHELKQPSLLPPGQAQKKRSGKRHPQQDRQFHIIADYRSCYECSGNPILSMDTKKKALLGDLFRPGHTYTQEGS